MAKISFSPKNVGENLLFALNIFILFLLIFADKISLHAWLQSVGRMHPLLLHFPIVMLMMAVLLDVFRYRTAFADEKFYPVFTTNLLLGGTLLSAITVIMGLFLSREEGYEGSVLQWHKWSGISVVFIASLIYWARNKTWYTLPAARLGSFAVVLSLILAGHFGAEITHGENYVLAPVSATKNGTAVPFEEAATFADVIQPILKNKCVSCHNPEKIKGKLILTDEESILKGGKSGKLFVAGDPGLSLLLQRIHLPAEEKKHMPPSGKPQLTDEEMQLLRLWIKNRADFKGKISALTATDSFRIVSASLFEKPETEESYDFAAADEKTIKQLSNNYRVVYPLAKESPALAVDFFNKDQFKPASLSELEKVKDQIVYLNLNKMPIKDADLKVISSFKNLRTLNLNFTSITGSGLKNLSSLQNLESLSLSGSAVDLAGIKPLLALKNLKKVVLWETKINAANIPQLKKANRNIDWISGYSDDGKHPDKLTPPQLKNEFLVFEKPVLLQLKHPVKGVQIRFTTNGSKPDSVKSALYNGKTRIEKNTEIFAKAYKNGWLGSDSLRVSFYKSAHRPDSIHLLTVADGRHLADGGKTLSDKELSDFNTDNLKWLGYKDHMLELEMYFKTPVPLSSVGLHVLSKPGSEVFIPESFEIFTGTKEKPISVSVKKTVFDKKNKEVKTLTLESNFKTKTVSYLKIRVKPRKYLLIDEVFLN